MNSTVAKWFFFIPVRLLRSEPILHALSCVREYRVLKHHELKNKQLKLIQNQVEIAFNKVPYFHNHWKSVLKDNAQIDKLQHFEKIPIIEKTDVQNNRKDLSNPEIRKFDIRRTSGSSGTPLQFIKDRQATAFMDAVMYDAYSWHGIKPGDRQARFWGLPHDKKNQSIARVKDFLMNRKRLSAFQLSVADYRLFVKQLWRWKPHYFYGYPSLMCEFADFINEHSMSMAPLNLKAVICTGEQLNEEQRKHLNKTFHCPVVNEYGCTEVGVIGFECPMGNLHEMSLNIYFEILKNGVPVLDEEGEVAVTELHARTSPFIRYKTGDRGVRCSAVCSCGLASPVIKILSGRIDDYILTPEGGKIYDAILAYTLKKGVKKFKAIQREIGLLEIMIVTDEDFSEELLESYLVKFKREISSEMQFVFKQVRDIPQEKSGKLRYFRSEIH